MALKKTSETIMIGATTPSFGAFAEKSVDLQLNPLDNEVFVVQAIEFDLGETISDTDWDASVNDKVAAVFCSVSTTSRTSVGTLNDSNVLASAHLAASSMASNPNGFDFQQKPDTAAAILDYIGIIATADFFIQTGVSNLSDTLDAGALRLYGYRAKADAATYAALVQSEVLSS